MDYGVGFGKVSQKKMKIGLYMCGGEKPESGVPLGIGYLLTNSNVLSADITYCETRRALEVSRWDIVGLSAVAAGLPEAVEIAKQYRDAGSPEMVALGGQSTLWGGLDGLGLFDWIIEGEGELMLPALLSLPSGRHKATPVRLDALNFPERGYLYGGKVPMVTSRGCPWRCAFCSSSQYWGKPRYCSPKYFIAEVEDILKKYLDARWLYIMDDLFTAHQSRFDIIYDLWMKRGLNRRLGLWSFVRANTFNERQALRMKEMGFRAVRFGAESGSDRVLELLGKRATVEMNQQAIDAANKAGLNISCSYMWGIPSETEQERQETLDFIERNRGKAAVEGYYQFVSFPGMPMYDGASPLTTDMRNRA